VTGKPVHVECGFPDDLNVALERLRG